MPYGGMTLLMALILWVISGIFVGLVFSIIMGTGEHGGFIGYVVFAVIGGIVSGIIYRLMGNMYTESWQVDVMISITGAVILMVIAQLSHQKHRPRRGHYFHHHPHHHE